MSVVHLIFHLHLIQTSKLNFHALYKYFLIHFNHLFFSIICPDNPTPGFVPSLWSIMSKVRLESFLWGAGTALGELPPYFMAKAARLSGYDPDDDEDFQEFEELQKKKEHGEKLSTFENLKLGMERIVERVGFLGILACASVSLI